MFYQKKKIILPIRYIVFCISLLHSNKVTAQTAWPSQSWSSAVNLTSILNPSGTIELSGLFWNDVTKRLYTISNIGQLKVLQYNSVTNNFDNRQNGENGGNIENGKNGKYGFSDNIPHLQIGKNVKIIRLFDTPIDTITISNNHSNSGGMYVRSGIKIVYLNNNFDKISPVENIHSHVVTSITLLEKRPEKNAPAKLISKVDINFFTIAGTP